MDKGRAKDRALLNIESEQTQLRPKRVRSGAYPRKYYSVDEERKAKDVRSLGKANGITESMRWESESMTNS